MPLTRHLAVLLAALAVGSVQAEEPTPSQGDSGSDSGVIDKTGRAVGKGAQAAADGAEYVAEKVVKGVKRGATATARAIDRGGRATGKALGTAADKVGLSDKGKPADTAAPAGNSAGSDAKP